MITNRRMGHDGRLGNQLFQYAMLRSVAMAKGYEVRIPMNFNAPSGRGRIELAPFALQCEEFRPEDRAKINGTYEEGLGKAFTFHPEVFDQADGTDFIGYFQSEKYFAAVADRIRGEFRLKSEIAEYAAKYVDDLRTRSGRRQVVNVQVRRGDYLNLSHLFHVLSAEFFQRAMAMMNRLEQDIVFLVLSDGMPWCKANLVGDNIYYSDPPTHWHDLAIQSNCDHNIISGSSFGWWGAWLNANPNKRVIAPSPWVKPALATDVDDGLPASWLRLDVAVTPHWNTIHVMPPNAALS